MGKMPESMKIYVVADDLTGSCDTGVKFTMHGLNTLVLPKLKEDEEPKFKNFLRDFEVIVMNTESRSQDGKRAREVCKEVSGMLRGVAPGLLYKKIDSTMRGNIGPELEGVLEGFNADFCVLSPSYPAMKRVVVGGYELVDSRLLSKTEFGHDPVTPINESHIPTLIGRQTLLRVGHVRVDTLLKGENVIRTELLREFSNGAKIVVVDAVHDEDLDALAGACLRIHPLPVLAGSTGLAQALSKKVAGREDMAERPGRPSWAGYKRSSHTGLDTSLPVLIVSGSANPTTRAQVVKVGYEKDLTFIEIDISKVLYLGQERECELRASVNRAVTSLEQGSSVIITVPERRKDSSELVGRGNRLESSKIRDFLGDAVLNILRRVGLGGLILTGGDTALGVLEKLGAFSIYLEGEVAEGIPTGAICGGEFGGLRIVTKAGGFGKEDAMVKVVDYFLR